MPWPGSRRKSAGLPCAPARSKSTMARCRSASATAARGSALSSTRGFSSPSLPPSRAASAWASRSRARSSAPITGAYGGPPPLARERASTWSCPRSPRRPDRPSAGRRRPGRHGTLVQLLGARRPAPMPSIVPYVAIVDDEEPVRKALKRLLRASGLEADSYASGKEFLDATLLREPDCVLLDLHMPRMTGLQVLRALKATRHALPIIIITAHDAPEAREQCLAAGATAYLRKPLEEHELLDTITAALGARTP